MMQTVACFILYAALALCALAVPIPPERHGFDRGPTWITRGTGTPSLTSISRPRPVSIVDSLTTSIRQDTATSNFTFAPANVPDGLDIVPALTEAKAIMDRNWPSNQDVLVNIAFAKIGGKDVLANGGGTRFVTRADLGDGKEAWPVAAAESVLGTQINDAGVPEIEVTINTGTNWHVDTSTTVPASQYDFITVLLHEIYHQLIFSGKLKVKVASTTTSRSGVTQTLGFEKGGPARFDRFLANEDGCQVLDYQKAEALATRLGVTTDQLAAFAVTNDRTFFWSDGQAGSLAKMHSPPIWVPKESAYHFDAATATGNDAIMSNEISPGRAIREIGPKIRSIQSRFLDTTVTGAKSCDVATLVDPTPSRLPTDSDRSPINSHGTGIAFNGTGAGTAGTAGAVQPPVATPQSPVLIAGMRRWVFVLVIIFSILGALLAIGLCVFLVLTFLRARKKKDTEYDDSSDVPTAEYQSDNVNQEDIYGAEEQEEQPDAEHHVPDDMHDGSGDLTEGGSAAAGGAAAAGAAAGAAAAGAAAAGAAAAGKGDGTDGADDDGADGGDDDGAAGQVKNGKKKKKKNGMHGGGMGETSDEYDSHEGADAYGRSVCPSSRKKSRHGASEVPQTFDPSSVPSPSSRPRRSGSSKRPKGCNDYYSSGSSSEYSGSGGGGQCQPHPKSSKSKSMSKSRSGRSMKPGSVCPPSTKPPTCGDYKNGVDGGEGSPFDCETPSALPYDCDTTIFDCNTISKAATAFAVSEKPIPRIANPSESSKSRYLYLDSETTDSTHLHAYERGSSQKNPVAHAKSPKSPRKKPTAAKIMPMSLAPDTMDKSESTKVPSTKVPAANPITRSSSKRSKRSKSSKHVPSTYVSSSEGTACEYMDETMDPSSKYDSTMGSELCKRGACKPMSIAPTSTMAPASTEPPTTTMQPMTTDFFDCTDAPPTKCKSKSSKSSHSAKSSGKKSSSRKEDGKENECSNGKKSSSKHSSSKRSSSCKRSQSCDSIKSAPKCKLPSTKPPESCAPNSFDDESSHPSTAYESSKHPSSCPPSSEKEKLPSVCPTSEGKHATRYHGDSKRRRRADDGHTTKVTTTKMYKAKYEDGRLVDKKSRTKETTKKYAATEDPTSTYLDYSSTTSPTTDPSSMYTSSYFNSEDDKTTTIQPTKYSHRDDDKSSRRHRHHGDSERSHSRHRHHSRSRSRSRSNADELTRTKSERRRDDHHRRERSSRHGDEMRRSRSEKDVRYESRSKYIESDELKRTNSKHGLKKSKSHHSISTKHYQTPVVPTVPVPATRRTDIHTVALDSELQSEYERSKRDKSERYETQETRSTRHRAKSSSRSHRRERSPSRDDKERRERSQSRERRERRERSPSRERRERRERSPSRERRERRERSPSRERRYEYDDGQMTVVKKKKKVTKVHVHVDRDRVHVEEY